MKDRLALAILLVLSWIILFIFQKYVPIQSAIYVLLFFMSVYVCMVNAAQLHQKRKIKKLIKTKSFKERFFDQSTYEPFVSIIIPAHNEENVIENTVKNILELDYSKYELILVDDRSTDNTAEVIKNLSRQYPKVKNFIREYDAFPGKSAVLNEALLMTQGDVIAVFDADARIGSDFLKKIVPYLADRDIGAVQARKLISNREFNVLTRCQDNEYILDAHFQSGRDCIKGAVELRGNGQLIKKEALIDVEGWNNHTITDDLDLSTRLHLKGWDIRLAEDVDVFEEGVTSFWALLRQRRRWIEGSIRRYLDYFNEILFSKKVSLRVSIDMFAYISEFVLPVWMISEYFIQGFRFVKGTEDNILYTLALAPALFLFFAFGLVFSLKKTKNFTLKETFKQSIITGIYLIIIWVPIVTFIIFKIIFSKRSMDWGKTDHGTAIPEPQIDILAENSIDNLKVD